MHLLVTGATGHLGSFVVPLLLQQGHDVAALVRSRSRLSRLRDVQSRITLIRGDLPTVEEAVRAFQPESVIHLAWSGITRETRNLPEQIYDNVPYALDLLRMARAAGAKSWIGLGSQAEYGPVGDTLRESLPLHPDTAYGVAKVAVSNLTRTLCHLTGIRHVWLRLVATYGPADDERHLIPALIRNLTQGASPALSSGTQLVDYLYAADAAEAIVACALHTEVDGIFNLASGTSVTVGELANMVRDMIAAEVPLVYGAVDDSAEDLKADITRLREAVGWQPRTPLRDGLATTIEWYAKQSTTGALP